MRNFLTASEGQHLPHILKILKKKNLKTFRSSPPHSQNLFLNEIFGIRPLPGKVWGLQEREHLCLRSAGLHIWAPDDAGQVGACTSGPGAAKAHLESSSKFPGAPHRSHSWHPESPRCRETSWERIWARFHLPHLIWKGKNPKFPSPAKGSLVCP